MLPPSTGHPASVTKLSARFLCPALLLAAAGCSESRVEAPPVPSVPEVVQTSSQTETASASATGWRKYDGIRFNIPEDWEEVEARMVDSKYAVQTTDGRIEITLTSMGGGIDANLNRWVKQMQQIPGESVEEDVLTLDGVEAKLIDVRGTFSQVSSQSSTSNSRLIGVALPISPRDFYVKLTGPRDAVASYQDNFRAFLKTAEITD